MPKIHYALGLDIGIGSVGWAVLQNDQNGEPFKIENLGVRVFDKAEQPKTGESLAAPRRNARSARRRIRRHRHRLERIRYLLEREGIITMDALAALYEKGSFEKSPYQLRAEALDHLLTKEEIARVLIHIAQRRGYKSNSTAEAAKDEKETGKVKAAITENRQRMAQHGYRTVGEMMYRDEAFWQQNPDGSRYHQARNKAENYRFTVERAMMVDEIHAVFAAQRDLRAVWMTPDLEKEYLAIFESQRNFDEGPGGDSPFRGGIEGKVGTCSLETEANEPRAAKATYTFEYFKLLQDISRIRLVRNGLSPEPLDEEQAEVLRNAAMAAAGLSYGQLRKKLCLDDDTFFHGLYYGENTRDEAEKRKWPQMQSYHKMRQALDKLDKNTIKTLSREQLDEIATILTLYKNDANRIDAFRKVGIPELYDGVLLPLSFSKFGSLSVKAMQKLIPFLEKGARYDEACREVYGDHRTVQAAERKEKLALSDMEEIANPVVRRALAQTIKVINAVVRTYGRPDVVRIELAREMGKNFTERRKIEKQQEENFSRNEKAKEQIAEYKGDRATGLDIVKFKLFREQDGVCLYSGKNLDISRLFDPGYVDIDHIVPYSRSFDDSYKNKVLVLASENRQKGNRLPYEYLGQDPERWHSYEVRVETLIHSYGKRQKLLKRSLSEEESGKFIARNLKDTQYITRTIASLVRDNLAFAESVYKGKERKQTVETVNGAVTSMLRSRWGVQKIREDGDLHHCLDAAVVAATSPGLIRKLTEYSKRRENAQKIEGAYLEAVTGELIEQKEYDARHMPLFPPPWNAFRKELEARLDPVDPRLAIEHLHLAAYDGTEDIKPIFVSRMPRHKVTGAAHQETIRSAKAGSGAAVSKTPLSKLNLDKNGEIPGYYNAGSDLLLYHALVERLKAFGGKGEHAFREPFYKPKKDGTPGPRVDKVKIVQPSTLHVTLKDGIAANGDMIRIDVFHIEGDGYYFVPIYVADAKKAVLPNRAVVAHKPYAEWKEMSEDDFLFSLYAGDLVRIRSKRPISLFLAKGGTGQKQIERTDALFYYAGANISIGAVSLTTHDRRYENSNTGFKTLLSVEKYQVDVLGGYHRVKLPEKRMGFTREV